MPDLLDRLPSLHDPLTLRLLLPLVLGFALAGIIRLAAGARGRAFAGAAIALSAMTVLFMVAGLPAVPPSTAADKIAWLTITGLALGMAFDLLRAPPLASRLALILWPAAIIGWIGLDTVLSIPRLPTAGPEGAFQSLVLIALLLGFWIAGSTALSRLGTVDDSSAATMLLVAAAALGLVLLHSGMPRLGVPALALASATGGFLIWNLGRTRFPFGNAAVLGGGSLLLAIAASFAVAAENAVALVILALLVLVFFADRSVRRVPLGTGRTAGFAAPLILALVAAVPALAAVAVAILVL